jgi:hypothetical protein
MANSNVRTASTANVQNADVLSWASFCEKAKENTFVVPLRLKAGETVIFTDYKEKETKTGKMILLLVTKDSKEVPLFCLPEIAQAIQSGQIPDPKEKPLSVKITEVIKNDRGYFSYLCMKTS